MSFNSKLAIQLVKQAPNHKVQLTAMDLEAEREGMAINRGSRCILKGSRLLSKPRSRQSLRIDTY
jgi:hypothetical protein